MMCLLKRNKRTSLVLFVIFLISNIFFTYTSVQQSRWPQGIIAQIQHQSGTWFMTTQNGFFIQDVSDRQKKRIIPTKAMLITHHSEGIVINGIPLAQTALIIIPRTTVMTINGISYQGIVRIIYKSGVIGLQVIGSRRGNQYEKQKVPSLNKIVQSFHDLSQQLFHTVGKNMQETFDVVNQHMLRTFAVRVLLNEWQGMKKGRWNFYSPKGFMVQNQAAKKKHHKKSELIITMKKGKLYIDEATCGPLPLYLTPVDGNILFNGATYHGSFVIKQNKNSVQCINHLDMENYVFSVLRTESWPGWPVEINKALAIASRSYVIAQAMRARKNGRLYDVKNTNEHQTYHGIHTSSIIKQAVDETKGIFLGFNNEPILAMFDSCCGGIVPAGIADVNFAKAPYLARDYACTHCKNCKIYAWETSYEHASFERLIRREMKILDRLRDIKITKKDKAGLVSEVMLKGMKKWVKLSGKKFYSLLKDVKSFCFNIRKKGNNIIVKGRGFGHHLGLCQWGAREMVRDGWDYKQILQFYYPGTRLMCLV